MSANPIVSPSGKISTNRLVLISVPIVLIIFLILCGIWPHLKDVVSGVITYILGSMGLKGNEDRLAKVPRKEPAAEPSAGAAPEAEPDRPPLSPKVYEVETEPQDPDTTLQGTAAEAEPEPHRAALAPEAVSLILEFEGLDQPSRWPGAASGITIGHGYDLGYQRHFAEHWAGILEPTEIETLSYALGKRGTDARDIANLFRGIHITAAQARAVFERVTIPQQVAIAREFCGAAADRLPDLCFGAVVSLVFNRGPAVTGKNREEMRRVRDAIRFGDDGWREVPGYIRAMKRIWKGRDIERGMTRRREAEAAMFERGLA